MTLFYTRSSDGPLRRNNSYFDLRGARYRLSVRNTRVGEGESGIVRRFQSADRQDRVVKKPHKHNASLAQAKKEVSYYQRAYPELDVYLDEHSGDDYRLIMPDLGQELCDYVEDMDLAQITSVFNNVIDELARLHALGITHYDIQARNILVDDKGKVWFIDGVTYSRQRPTQIYDIQRLAELLRNLGRSVSPLYLIDMDTSRHKMNSLHLLRAHVNEASSSSGMIAGPGPFFNPDASLPFYMMNFSYGSAQGLSTSIPVNKILSADYKKSMRASQQVIQDAPVLAVTKAHAEQVLIDLVDAVKSNDMSEADAKMIMQKTDILMTSPEQVTRSLDYLNVAKKLSGSSKHNGRKLAKIMAVVALGVFIVALSVSSVGVGAVVAAGIGVGVFSLLAIMARKSRLQCDMEKVALSTMHSDQERLLKTACLRMS